MSVRTVAAKMGVRAGARAFLVDAPPASVEAMSLPPLEVAGTLAGLFDHLHLFTLTQRHLDEWFPLLRQHLAPTGTLWVSWPKGRKRGTDLTLPAVIRIGYSHGLVESTCLSIDATWSGLKFTHPKPGKHYQNSYGVLPGQQAGAADEPTDGSSRAGGRGRA